MKSIDVELARSLLEYSPEIGGSCLRWKVNKGRAKTKGVAGNFDSDGYWRISIKGKLYMAHRLVWAIVNGEDPPCQIDHIHGKEVGNHIENLRLAINNDVDNGQNKKQNVNNTSGFTGVSWRKDRKKWAAHITVNKRKQHLGHFVTAEEAYSAYIEAKRKLHLFNPKIRP